MFLTNNTAEVEQWLKKRQDPDLLALNSLRNNRALQKVKASTSDQTPNQAQTPRQKVLSS
jgi:hypothetical protein